ncbi:MAG TPA: formylglycine-generating enzyme family protein [Kiritimatiellia bacterium]|nr:formylglycine-generating enzyme family protein [Kiritimatiellia bacterium]HPS06794.1 formylglycine-generating enzyme family protein [Kiritimatiellia bacterium]
MLINKFRMVAACLSMGTASFVSAQASVNLGDATLTQNTVTRMVEASYTLTGDTPVYVTLGIETNGVAIPAPVSVWGDVSTLGNPIVIAPGETGKKIYWQAKKDWPSNLTTQARAVVAAWFTNDPPASIAPYVVVDLSGGSTATNYPVRYSVMAPDLTTNTCKTTELWLRRISAGTYTMGSPTNEVGREADQFETQHTVTLTKDFCIGVFETTQQQWYQVMGTKPSFNTNVTYWAARPVEQVSWCKIREGAGGSTLRADAQTWPASEAVGEGSFMYLLRQRAGLKFDLPTEAQWEYACRAGTDGAWNNGTTISNAYSDANMAALGRYVGNTSSGLSPDRNCTTSYNTTLVGSYCPNAWGLYDMHGNIIEYCLDRIASTAKASNLGTFAVVDPLGPSSGASRVFKGGGCASQASGCRSSYRNGIGYSLETHPRFGFRIAIQP